MCIIEDNTELDRIVQTTKFNVFQLVDSPLKQPMMSSQELLGGVLAPANDTAYTSGLAPRNGSNGELRTGVDPCQGLLSFPNIAYIMYTCVNTCCNTAFCAKRGVTILYRSVVFQPCY